MNIIRGKIQSAKKVVIYGPEGIGKSTFASRFPEPVFIDTEDSTKDMDVARFEKPTSWQMLLQEVQYVIDYPECCKTLVIDTADWAEQLEITSLCAKKGWSGLEDPGYGKGYQYSAEEFGKLLNMLSMATEKGVHVVLTAHAWLRKIELPDEMGAYDHWEMKTSKKVAPMIREWADAVLFANYKTIVVNVDGQGAQKGKNKAQGGKRVMYTSHHPCWDAKNRYGLPEEVPFDYGAIAHIIESGKEMKAASAPSVQALAENQQPVSVQKPVQQELPLNLPVPEKQETVPNYIVLQHSKEENVPKALLDLMIANHVTEWDIQNAVGEKGYFPSDVPIEQYPDDFVQGCLVAAWPKVYDLIVKTQKTLNKEIPFK